MNKFQTFFLITAMVMGLWLMEAANADVCGNDAAKNLGYYYEEMAYYLDIVQEPMTFDWHKVQRWPDFNKAYNTAIKAKLSDTCAVIVSDTKKKDGVKVITFGELKALYPQWAAIMDDPKGEDKITALKQSRNKASDEKAFGEFYRTLKGDKLNEFKKCKNCGWYTTGKKQMTTAKEFQNASIWCTEAWSDEGLGRWKVECTRFNGNKKGKSWTKSGTGSRSAPASAFK
jgi:hypothetical protein